jgi:hypothetical protein
MYFNSAKSKARPNPVRISDENLTSFTPESQLSRSILLATDYFGNVRFTILPQRTENTEKKQLSLSVLPWHDCGALRHSHVPARASVCAVAKLTLANY